MSRRCRAPLWSQHRWVHIFPLPAQCHMRRPCSWLRLRLLAWLHRLVDAPGRRGFLGSFSKGQNVKKKEQVCLLRLCGAALRLFAVPQRHHWCSETPPCPLLVWHIEHAISAHCKQIERLQVYYLAGSFVSDIRFLRFVLTWHVSVYSCAFISVTCCRRCLPLMKAE